MLGKKPVRKPSLLRGCESCNFRKNDFSTDTIDPNVIRCYCKARHVEVNAEVMSKDCDFYSINPEYRRTDKETDRYGL